MEDTSRETLVKEYLDRRQLLRQAFGQKRRVMRGLLDAAVCYGNSIQFLQEQTVNHETPLAVCLEELQHTRSQVEEWRALYHECRDKISALVRRCAGLYSLMDESERVHCIVFTTRSHCKAKRA